MVRMRLPLNIDDWADSAALPYTAVPWKLFWYDLKLFAANAWALPYIIWPIHSSQSTSSDELVGTLPNFEAITIHIGLCLAQSFFLLSIIPLLILPVLPFGAVVIYVLGFIIINQLLCNLLLNGQHATLESDVDLRQFPQAHPKEKWIFINGIAVGQTWLQSNINRIALSFGRPVTGVHNPTSGILFDLIQCLVERDLSYPTTDVRQGFATVEKALYEGHDKVIIILHSQGGIEGSLILDWLYASVPGIALEKIEVYTFGNAANHFNNPQRVAMVSSKEGNNLVDTDVIKHIEHYGNSEDFVARWGVLHYASISVCERMKNRYEGRVFERNGTGHLLNQHYLGTMFPLDLKRGWGVLEHNDFMDSPIVISSTITEQDLSMSSAQPDKKRVGQVSRLWTYRNSRSPED